MIRPLLLAVIAILAFGRAQAEVVHDLYRGEAIVTGQDNSEERARGIRLALTRVLVKVSGDPRVADHPDLPAVLADAENYVLRYTYEDRKKGIRISDEQGTRDRSYRLRVDFDRDAILGVLSGMGLGLWREDRPRLLVVLAVTDHSGPYLLGTEAPRGVGQRETMLYDADLLGLPVVIPKMDSFETTAVSYRDVAATNGAALGAFAAAYQADAVLSGTMVITADGHWNTDWTLLADEMPVRWRVPDASFDKAIADGLGISARMLAGAR